MKGKMMGDEIIPDPEQPEEPMEAVRYLSIVEQLTDLKSEALAKAGGNYSQLARDLGIRRATVHSWFRLRNVFPRGRHIEALETYVGGRQDAATG